jgi:hypothetical protein
LCGEEIPSQETLGGKVTRYSSTLTGNGSATGLRIEKFEDGRGRHHR